MFLELSEVFVCPLCRPAQGLVVIVEEIEDRRLLEGALGCPECEVRFPVRRGVIRFDRPAAEDRAGEAAAAPEAASAGGEDVDPGTEVAALLGVREAKGYLLLGPGLHGVAARVAGLAEKCEVLALLPDGSGAAVEPGVSPARGVDPGSLPLLSGRMAGAALLAPGPEAAREAARVVAAGGRLAVLRPGPGLEEALSGCGMDVVAAEERALVAVRRG